MGAQFTFCNANNQEKANMEYNILFFFFLLQIKSSSYAVTEAEYTAGFKLF